MNNGFVSIVLALILVAGAFLTWLFWDDISGKTKEKIEDNKQEEQVQEPETQEPEAQGLMSIVYDMPIYC